ncbi:MAG: FtsX-like permease family protein, partial [Planctomycetota bacterium]|nr:FtsX-like permease family protein [Planctomycetota bacterium]
IGLEKETKRNARDIGSNVVILPSKVDQVAYHEKGGYSDETMPMAVVDQLIEFKASLNHLIPTLETRTSISHGNSSATTRVVGISASIPMPGRPKAPMQRAIKDVQIGSALAKKLNIKRDSSTQIEIRKQLFNVSRVNKSSGTWRDSVAFIDLKTAQELFEQKNQISRIEAIECTSEKCEELGVSATVVLNNELANITDQAQILRRQTIADARNSIRTMSAKNLNLLENVLWVFLVISLTSLGAWNSAQRRSEIGVFRAIGFTQEKILVIFVSRALLLAIIAAGIGLTAGSLISLSQVQSVFETTGKKVTIDWRTIAEIGILSVSLSLLATVIPAVLATGKHPAEIIGKDSA